ncbi:helix-turn-helix domain-containing protein [Phytohabitans rumicis]|uniref:AraC family transcriptional regulator n=1 Tax=Phytohabitans rumicis TaxID=1076125 RepID=A0A6V8LEW7_9ACTN|nr:helix-turn-helix domain-containing protein [Phytohabitans rumicis]GFJ94824.1 AraC family transcriptional regulator [Phytohabitans rumicis]
MDGDRLGQTRQQTTSEYGLLGVRGVDFRIDRVPASAGLAALVERHWLVSWDLPEGRRAPVTLLPHPCVNLIVDRGQAMIGGVGRERFTYECAGSGRVFGVKFRPGGFLPFLGQPVSQLTGEVRPLAWLWGAADAGRFAADLAACPDLDALVDVAERHLLAHWPAPDPEVARVGEVVRALLHDRSVTRVSDVSGRFGMSPRSLQRLFERYVGVSPKWVLQRYRLHEAAARLAEGTAGTWGEVAAELGYFDQSHFIRDFTRAVGMTPVAYADACTRHQHPVTT